MNPFLIDPTLVGSLWAIVAAADEAGLPLRYNRALAIVLGVASQIPGNLPMTPLHAVPAMEAGVAIAAAALLSHTVIPAATASVKAAVARKRHRRALVKAHTRRAERRVSKAPPVAVNPAPAPETV